MCGVAGFSLAEGHTTEPSIVARLLVAGLAERGEDACGVAWLRPGRPVEIVKAALPPDEFLATTVIDIPREACGVIVHVRDHTKGRPGHAGNDHPIRHGRITGVHNGIIQNDEALFAELRQEREQPGTSVDSEAIFMLLDALPSVHDAFGKLVGSYATAWFDDADPDHLHVVRGAGRPLHVAGGPGITLFASTPRAVDFAARHADLALGSPTEVNTGRHLRLRGGDIVSEHVLDVRPFSEPPPLEYDSDPGHAVDARSIVLEQLARLRRRSA